MGAFAIPLIAATATVGSAYMNYRAGKENQKFQQNQRNVANKIDQLNQRRSKINAYKEYMAAQANVVQTGINSNGGGAPSGSSYMGGVSSLASQYAANTAFADQVNSLTNYGNSLVNKADKYSSYGQLFSAVGNLAGTTFGGYSEIKDTTKNIFR